MPKAQGDVLKSKNIQFNIPQGKEKQQVSHVSSQNCLEQTDLKRMATKKVYFLSVD